MTLTGYLAPEGLEHELADELSLAGVEISARHDRLFLAEGPPVEARWAANVWRDATWIPIDSIGHAARELKAIQRNWAAYSPYLSGRSRLITEKLPHVSSKPVAIGDLAPTPPLGSWMLVDPSLLLAAADCSDPFPNGVPRIEEDRTGPPSRAYLKLWEALARARRWPQPGEHCLDLGLTHFVDDHPEVHRAIRGTVEHQFFFGPQRKPVPEYGIHVQNWVEAKAAILSTLEL